MRTVYLLLTVPSIAGRYYTVQFLNGWGDTIANINERVYPEHPSGAFAICLKGSPVAAPSDAMRVDLPAKAAHVVVRIEPGSDANAAVAFAATIQDSSRRFSAASRNPKDSDVRSGADAGCADV
jgi:hypothetical protein